MKIPIAFPKEKLTQTPQLVIAADVGGTKTHLALSRIWENRIELLRESKFPSKEYNSFKELLEIFRWNDPMPDAISIAFAGPILNGRAQATNLNWFIDIHELSSQLRFKNIFLINDLEANAYGLATLEDDEFYTIHTGNPALKGNAAIIAPGTGLGEAGLYWDGQYLHPFATEGGHADFGPQDVIDDDLLNHLRKEYDHVSWERLVSGPGIWTIYEFLSQQNGNSQSELFFKQNKATDKAALVSDGARNGDPLCKKAMDLFFKYLAFESANIAVKYNATGALFIGGGVVPKNLDLLDKVAFQKHFFDKGRLRPMLEQVPIYVLLNEKTTLLGAAHYGAYAKSEGKPLKQS